MCEFLIYAKTHWMEEVPQNEKDKWSDAMWEMYNKRVVKGNPIVVKPNGWKWGKEERPPNFIVAKIPNMKAEEALKYLEPAFDESAIPHPETGKEILFAKRYRFDVQDVDAAVLSNEPIMINEAVLLNKLEDRQP